MLKKAGFLTIFSLLIIVQVAQSQGADCNNADPFCTGTTYTFPNSTNVPDLGPVDCLGSSPNPAWYFMEIDQNGPMTITMNQTNGGGSGIDVDFILWGPYTSLAAACASNLMATPGVDCSYSTSAQETATIPNAQIGQIYVLLLTNFSNQPGTISFSQTGGAGSADCSFICGVTGFTAVPTACVPATNTYSVSGTLSINNPPATGTLTISNSCGGSQVFNPPFGTSFNYNFTGLTANGAGCVVSSVWSADPTCNTTVNYTAPPPCTTPCIINNFTANVSAPNCTAVTYGITGQVAFSNAPATGTLTVSSSCGGSQVFNAPFASPLNYSLAGIPANGANCTVTAVFSAAPGCTQNIPYTSPTCPCNMDSLVVFHQCDPLNNGDYNVDVHLVFSNPPATGQLTVNVCGNIQTVNAPFTSPIDLTFIFANTPNSNCTVTASFTANPACQNSLSFIQMNCLCAADAGTITANSPGSGIVNHVLCDNDQINITSTGYSPPDNVGLLQPGNITYNPGLVWLIYSCNPTTGDPNTDPCFQGIYSTGTTMNDINDMFVINAFPPGTFTNNTVYYVPMTFYNVTGPTYYWNPNCYEMGTPTAVTYLPPIVSNGVENCQAGSVTVTLSGGQPAILGGNFTASALTPATASFANTTAGNNGTIVITGLQEGQSYGFTVTDANGCPHTFNGGPFNGPPVANAGPDQAVCVGVSANLNATGGVFYLWTPAATLNNPNISNPVASPAVTTTYTVIVDDGTGCTGTDQVTITVNNALDATISPAGPFCASNPATFLTAVDPGGTWSGPGITNATTGQFTPSAAGPGTHTITYSIPGSCGSTDTEDIQVIADADATVTPAGPFCISAASVTLTGAQLGGTWSGNGITNAATGVFDPAIAGPGTHTITYTISGVCGDVGTTNITVNPQTAATINPAGPFCVNSNALNLTAANPGGTWSGTGITNPAVGTFDPSAAGAGTHTITYITSGNCPDTGTTTIVVNPLPTVSFTGDTLVGCSPVCVDFSDLSIISSGSIAQWNWSFGDGTVGTAQNPTHCYTNPTFNSITFDVTLTVVSAAGCSATQTIPSMVTVFAIPDAEFSFGPQPTTVLFPEIEFVNLSAGASTYDWTFDVFGTSTLSDPTFVFPNDTSGTYVVCLTATSSNGCVDDICHTVVIDEEFSLYVPNAFTPDGNGTNDIFYPVIEGYNPEFFELMIFNRWGELIYKSDDASKGWDGTHKGTKAKTDVYVWKIKARDATHNERKSFYGHVSLLR